MTIQIAHKGRFGQQRIQQTPLRFGGGGCLVRLDGQQQGKAQVALQGQARLNGQLLRKANFQQIPLGHGRRLRLLGDGSRRERFVALAQCPDGQAARHKQTHNGHKGQGEAQPFAGALLALALGLFGIAGGQAGVDELRFGRVQGGRTLGQPSFRFSQGHAAQESAIVSAALLPLAQGGPQAFLPRPKGAVGLHPAAQLPPCANQGFVDDFGRFLPLGVAVGHDEAVVGQFLDEWPMLGADFGAAGHAAGVFGAFAGAHHLGKNGAGASLLG